MARIPNTFIDDLLARVDIGDVIGKRIALKRKGRELAARCPFHDERSASFYVSPQKQFYHCFGCGAHGTAVGFLMNYEGLDFVDAVETLASELGLPVPYEGGGFKREDGADALFPLLSEATLFFRQQLDRSDVAKAYLEKRGVDRATAERFQIGFAPADYQSFLKSLGTGRERLQLLEGAGLVGNSERGPYPKFRDRLMFPILDKRGRSIAFGGRIMGPGEPKYLNSPETALFKKSQELYGLYFARQDKPQRLLVVEGYMDVVSLVQFGIPEVVATLGTATSREHAEILFRSAEEVVFCFDGDRAGKQAAWRALVNTLPRMREGRQAKFLFLPDGEDPDTLVRAEGTDAFRLRVQNAQPLSGYFFDEMGKQTDLGSIDGRARLVEKAKPLLETIPDGAFRDLMEAELSRLSGLQRTLSAPASRNTGDRRSEPPRNAKQRSLVQQAIALLLANPQAASQLQPPFRFAALEAEDSTLLLALIELARERPDIHSISLCEEFRGQPDFDLLMQLLAVDLPGDSELQSADLLAAVQKLNARARELRIQELKQALSAGSMSEVEKTELLALLQNKSA